MEHIRVAMPDKLWEWLVKEATIIRQTPVSFAFASLLGIILSFFLLQWIYKEDLAVKNDTINAYRARYGDLKLDAVAKPANDSPIHEQQLVLKHDAVSFAWRLQQQASRLATNATQVQLPDDMSATLRNLYEQFQNARVDTSKMEALCPPYANGWTPQLMNQLAQVMTNLAAQLPNE